MMSPGVLQTKRESLADEVIVTAAKKDGKLWAFDGNRRLRVMKQLASRGIMDKVVVKFTDRQILAKK